MSSQDTSYNIYDRTTTIDWNGQHFILTARDEITGNSFAYAYSLDGLSWTKTNFYPNITTSNSYVSKHIGNHFIIAGNLVASSVNASGNTITQNCMIDVVDGQYPVSIPMNINGAGNVVEIYDIERNVEQPNRIVFPRTTDLAIGNTIAYSFDQGDNWTTISDSPFSASVNDAVWNGKWWVSVGTGTTNTIATSLDGVRWTGRGNYIFSTSGGGIDWSHKQKKYVAVGAGTNVVAESMDGVYWRGRNTNLFSAGGNDVKWGNNLWVAVGTNSNNTIAYSYDAVSWQYTAVSFQTAGLRLYYDGAVWTAFGQDPSYNIATSSDGIHWTMSYSAGATNALLNSPVGLFADPSLNIYPGIPYPLRSLNSGVVAKYICNHSDRGCAFIQPISIACGSGSCSLAYSIDGIQWSAINTSLFTHCNKSVWNGDIWVAVGAGAYWVATSYDGLYWTGSDSSIMTECYDVAWNGSYFVAVGKEGLARSADGILWTAINSVFSGRAHAIEWTGNVWLAYGSTGVAISSSQDASNWTSRSDLCIVDCSSSSFLSASASSYQGSNTPANAFDNSFNDTKWSSAGSNYDSSGNYTGSNVTQGISGEWLQVGLSSSLSCGNYYISFSGTDGSAIPQKWTLFGSNDGVSWSVVDTFDYGSAIVTPPSNSPFVCLPLSIAPNLVASYSYYRVVFERSFGANYVSVLELSLFEAGTRPLSRYIRPIVLKDLILHPTRVLSVGNGSTPNICRITDLSCNLIRSAVVRGGQYANNIIYGLGSEPSSVVFDGANHVVCSVSGEVSYLSNTASNTSLNFDTSMNGTAITGMSGAIYGACYNRKYILLGSYYGTLNSDSPPVFYSNNLSSLFTTIYGIASNSGYGFVVSPNKIYLREDEQLSLVTPKYYDGSTSSDTSVSFNVYRG